MVQSLGAAVIPLADIVANPMGLVDLDGKQDGRAAQDSSFVPDERATSERAGWRAPSLERGRVRTQCVSS